MPVAAPYFAKISMTARIYDVTPYTAEPDDNDFELGLAIDQALKKAKLDAPPSTAKGIDAIRLMSEGYTCGEISYIKTP